MTPYDPALDYRAAMTALKAGEKPLASAYLERIEAKVGLGPDLTRATTALGGAQGSLAWTLHLRSYRLHPDDVFAVSFFCLTLALATWAFQAVRAGSVAQGWRVFWRRFPRIGTVGVAIGIGSATLASWSQWNRTHPLGWAVKGGLLHAGPGEGFSGVARLDAGERVRKQAEDLDFCLISGMDRGETRGWTPCSSILLFPTE